MIKKREPKKEPLLQKSTKQIVFPNIRREQKRIFHLVYTFSALKNIPSVSKTKCKLELRMHQNKDLFRGKRNPAPVEIASYIWTNSSKYTALAERRKEEEVNKTYYYLPFSYKTQLLPSSIRIFVNKRK